MGISIIFTWTAAVIAATVVAFPLVYKTVLGSFEQVDFTLISSARTLGASEWRIFLANFVALGLAGSASRPQYWPLREPWENLAQP